MSSCRIEKLYYEYGFLHFRSQSHTFRWLLDAWRKNFFCEFWLAKAKKNFSISSTQNGLKKNNAFWFLNVVACHYLPQWDFTIRYFYHPFKVCYLLSKPTSTMELQFFAFKRKITQKPIIIKLLRVLQCLLLMSNLQLHLSSY